MSGRMSNLFRLRYVGVFIALAYLFLVMPASSSAFIVESDIAKLVERMSTDPHLEGWNSYSSADQAAMERALGDVTFLEKEYASKSIAEFLGHYNLTGLPEIAKNQISLFENEIETGVQALPDAGETAFLAGGEGLDAAASGIGVAAVGTAIGTVALGIGAFAGGYYIGTKFVELFNDSAVASEVETTFSTGYPIEDSAWQRIHICSFHCWESFGEAYFFGGEQNEVNGEHEVRTGPTYGTSGFSEHPALPEGCGVGCTIYVFVFRASPLFFCTECWMGDAVGTIPKTDEGKPWPYGDPTTEQEREGCEGGLGFGEYAGKIDGWPPHIKKTHLDVGNGLYKEACIPWEEVGCPLHCERLNKVEKYNLNASTLIWRTPSQLPVNFPKPGHSCPEGHTCTHTESPEFIPLEELLSKLPSAFNHEKHENLNHTIEHFEGESVPLPGSTEVPFCTELLATACKALMEEKGFTSVEISPVTWEHAVLTKPANAAISSNPAFGSHVETSHHIDISANPATMPLVIPAPNTGETATHYKERLETDGETNVTISTRAENDTNPHVGPDEVAGVSPAVGSATNPDGSTEIRVEANPSSASAPVEGSEGIGGPTLPGFNIPNFAILCHGFPFGVPCWLAETVESWSVTAVAPEWGIEDFTVEGHVIHGAKFQLSRLEPIMEKVRIAMLLFSTIGLVLLFYRFARGGSPPSGSGTNDESPSEPWG